MYDLFYFLADYLQSDVLLDQLYEKLRQNLFPSTVETYLSMKIINLPKIDSLLKHFMLAYGWRMLPLPSMFKLAPNELVLLLGDDHFVAIETDVSKFVHRYLMHHQGKLTFDQCLEIVGTIRFCDVSSINFTTKPKTQFDEATNNITIEEFASLLGKFTYFTSLNLLLRA